MVMGISLFVSLVFGWLIWVPYGRGTEHLP
jgi:hypothetical protein